MFDGVKALKTEVGEQLLGPCPHVAPSHSSKRRERLAVEEDVLHDREVRDERELLEHDTHPPPGGLVRVLWREGLSTEEHPSMVRLDDARNRLHQSGLTSAVLPQECVHLPGPEVKTHVSQCVNASESLGEALDD